MPVSIGEGKLFPSPYYEHKDFSPKSDFCPVIQDFGEFGEFDPRVWHGSRQNNKKRHKSWEKRLTPLGSVEVKS